MSSRPPRPAGSCSRLPTRSSAPARRRCLWPSGRPTATLPRRPTRRSVPCWTRPEQPTTTTPPVADRVTLPGQPPVSAARIEEGRQNPNLEVGAGSRRSTDLIQAIRCRLGGRGGGGRRGGVDAGAMPRSTRTWLCRRQVGIAVGAGDAPCCGKRCAIRQAREPELALLSKPTSPAGVIPISGLDSRSTPYVGMATGDGRRSTEIPGDISHSA
jgi:hypothetical protein